MAARDTHPIFVGLDIIDSCAEMNQFHTLSLKHHLENIQWMQESSCLLLTVAVSGTLCVFSQENPAHTVSAGSPQYSKI